MSKKKAKLTVRDELELIRKRNPDGLLVPEEVVEYARNPNTALHARFVWDDTEAARRYRVEQARGIIRFEMTVMRATNKPIRAYVRVKPAGYSEITQVLARPSDRRDLILGVARRILETLDNHDLPELAEIRGAVERLIARYEAAKRQRNAA
jgi:hypothetical protein